MSRRRFQEQVAQDLAEAFLWYEERREGPFPYQIFFRVDGPVIRVYAVLHGARHPDTWRGRLP